MYDVIPYSYVNTLQNAVIRTFLLFRRRPIIGTIFGQNRVGLFAAWDASLLFHLLN